VGFFSLSERAMLLLQHLDMTALTISSHIASHPHLTATPAGAGNKLQPDSTSLAIKVV